MCRIFTVHVRRQIAKVPHGSQCVKSCSWEAPIIGMCWKRLSCTHLMFVQQSNSVHFKRIHNCILSARFWGIKLSSHHTLSFKHTPRILHSLIFRIYKSILSAKGFLLHGYRACPLLHGFQCEGSFSYRLVSRDKPICCAEEIKYNVSGTQEKNLKNPLEKCPLGHKLWMIP